MQYEHEGVEIAISYTHSKDSQLISESNSKIRITVNPVVWKRQAIEFDRFRSCETIEKSAEFPHMEDIASNAANHLIPTTYGLQYNCGKFNFEYVSNSISFKCQDVG